MLFRDVPNVEFVVGSAEAIPFQDGEFDIIVINSVLQILPSAEAVERALAELVRVVTPGGLVFVGDLPFRSELSQGLIVHMARKLREYGARGFLRNISGRRMSAPRGAAPPFLYPQRLPAAVAFAVTRVPAPSDRMLQLSHPSVAQSWRSVLWRRRLRFARCSANRSAAQLSIEPLGGKESIVQLSSAILWVGDLDSGIAFYRDQLGLREVFRDEIASLLLAGRTGVVLHRADKAHEVPASRFSGVPWPGCGIERPVARHSLRFDIDDPDAWFAKLQGAGAVILEPPTDYFWGRSLLVADPDGRPISLARMAFPVPDA